MHGKASRRLARSTRRSTHGIAYVTEDRKSLGLMLSDDIKHNITLANLDGVSQRGVIDDMRGDSASPTTTASS